jgi:uroporphyrinogen-III synthase
MKDETSVPATAPHIWFTRALSPEDVKLLRRKGLEPVVHPLIEIQMRPVREIFDEADTLDAPDALLFTSKNAVDAFLSCRAVRPDWLADVPVYAVGQATAARLWKGSGLKANTPSSPKQDGTGVAQLIAEREQLGARIWHFGARNPRPEAGIELRNAGFHYDAITVYTTRLKTPAEAPQESFSAVAFYSPSAVEAFITNKIELPESCRLAAIGRTTEATLRQHGYEQIITPEIPDTEALAETLLARLNS